MGRPHFDFFSASTRPSAPSDLVRTPTNRIEQVANSSAASRAEALLPVAADRRSIWFPGMRQVRSEWLAAVLAWRWAFF